jgi:hypothetical protein
MQRRPRVSSLPPDAVTPLAQPRCGGLGLVQQGHQWGQKECIPAGPCELAIDHCPAAQDWSQPKV